MVDSTSKEVSRGILPRTPTAQAMRCCLQVQGTSAISPPTRQSSGTGRLLVLTVLQSPWMSLIQLPSSSGLRTVADMARMRTCLGQLIRTSSHTVPLRGRNAIYY